MQTLIVLTNSEVTPQSLMSSVQQPLGPKSFTEGGFSIERVRLNGTIRYVRVWKLDDPQRDYERDEVLPLCLGEATRGFLIEFNDLALLKDVAFHLLNRFDMAVDDDHGNIVIGTEFVEGLRNSSALPWLPDNYET